ncbi:uncharacterized protein LOC107638765 [Arachis ipaensis]|nr:uncharacterized protein LOC107638765 [Arachis ipaensis]XP_016197638.1 uncharacterized protein LOC107638765 [Arachis ipaensis]XP_025646137.1 uncharacterized protein LOC112741385 [Arachis hypogaea]
MGCISSKILARSISVHEERKQGSRRMANGIPLLEDLIISANGNDQYLALVCAANTVSNKLHSRSLHSNMFPELATEPVASETIDKLDISPRLSQEGGKQIERDKSWHSFPEQIVSSIDQGNLSDFQGKHNLDSKDVTGSRSFHTLEEYDNLVNEISFSDSPKVQQNEFSDEEADSRTIEELKVSALANTIHNIEDNDSAGKKMLPPCSHNDNSSEDSKLVKDISVKSITLESSTPSPNSHSTNQRIENEVVNPNEKTNIPGIAAQGVNTTEKVNKRKAIAKRLESLRIPSNVELPAIASLREWIPGSGIYSSASYVTPKFGSFSYQMDTRNESESSEDSVFSPELVSAFEMSMQILEAEEETILKQIIENVEEESECSPKEELHQRHKAKSIVSGRSKLVFMTISRQTQNMK